MGADTGLEGITIVLCRVEGAMNVGACCRAMKTMGVGRLRLADCPSFDEVEVRTHALHAYDVYEAAVRHASLSEALADQSLAAGLTRRTGRRRKDGRMVYDFARRLAAAPGLRVALVFGNERDGLSARELDLCDEAVSIPSSEAFPSLNLSHAVQLACWELRRSLALGLPYGAPYADGAPNPDGAGAREAPRSLVEASARRMADALQAAGLYRLAGRDDAEVFLRGLAARAGLSVPELERLEGLLKRLSALSLKGATPRGGGPA